jgi:hypothetical protein
MDKDQEGGAAVFAGAGGCGGDGGQAREQGLALTGPGGLLKLFTKSVLETALNEEMTEHLGYEKNGASPDRESANIRNGSRPKTVISDAVGEVEIAVPRDREGTFSPVIVQKRQRRHGDVDVCCRCTRGALRRARFRRISTIFMVRRCRRKRCPRLPTKSL